MTFEEILPSLRKGEIVRRKIYHSYLVVFMLHREELTLNHVIHERSIPSSVKTMLNKHMKGLIYHDLFLMYDFSDNRCSYYSFDGEDINADDWEVVDPVNYNPYEDLR